MKKKFKKGFSLVELLVVIAIIGILAAVGITAYSGYTSNAKIKASTSNHSSMVALLNSEFAKCASGEGAYAWSTTTMVPDPEGIGEMPMMAMTVADSCDSNPDHDNILAYINNVLGLKNPYETDVASAITGGAPGLGLTSITCSGDDCVIITDIAGADTTAVTVSTY